MRLLPGFMKQVVLDVVQQDMEWVCIRENSQMAMQQLVPRNDSKSNPTADFACWDHSSTRHLLQHSSLSCRHIRNLSWLTAHQIRTRTLHDCTYTAALTAVRKAYRHTALACRVRGVCWLLVTLCRQDESLVQLVCRITCLSPSAQQVVMQQTINYTVLTYTVAFSYVPAPQSERTDERLVKVL